MAGVWVDTDVGKRLAGQIAAAAERLREHSADLLVVGASDVGSASLGRMLSETAMRLHADMALLSERELISANDLVTAMKRYEEIDRVAAASLRRVGTV